MELATTVPTSRPALDPRAVAEAIDSHHDEDSYLPWYDADGEIVSSAAADAVMELAVPVPTREQIAEALERELRRQGADEFYDVPRLSRQLADVLALFIKGAE